MVEVPGYQIQRLLSWGSQGDVFLATDARGERVALKVVTQDRVDSEANAGERLRREGQLLAAISSPHIVGVREFLSTADCSCLALEYLEGQRLDLVVRARAGVAAEQERTLSASTVVLPDRASPSAAAMPRRLAAYPALQDVEYVAWALDAAVQFARGLAAMHAIDLVHRDIKPQNAMVVGDRVVLIDFGLARMDGLTTITQTGAAVGTLAFMSPEQLRGDPATKQSDVYGLGAAIFFCLTGVNPGGFSGRRIEDLGARRLPPSVRRLNPAVPKSVDVVLRRAMQPFPEDRYADAAAMLVDLERCRRGERVQMPFSPARLWRQRGRSVVVTAALVALAVLGWWLYGGGSAQRTAGRLIATVDEAPERVVEEWHALDEAQRAAVTAALNERVGPYPAVAERMARVLELGLLHVDGRARHRGVLLPTNGTEAPRSPSPAEFLSLEQPRCLLTRPGRAWFLVRSDETFACWSEGDPRVVQLLIDVQKPGPEQVAMRSLRLVATEVSSDPTDGWVHLQPCVVAVMGMGGEAIDRDFPFPIAVQALELSNGRAAAVASLLRPLLRDRDAVDWWLAHPDEPPAAADSFWQWVQKPEAEMEDGMPFEGSFWVAHRIATCLGCRVPTFEEWQRVAFADGLLGSREQRLIPQAPQPVDSRPEWDRTASGVCFANSNVAEWTLQVTRSGRVAAPAQVEMSEVSGDLRKVWSDMPIRGGVAAENPNGVRLIRTVVRGK